MIQRSFLDEPIAHINAPTTRKAAAASVRSVD